MAEEKHPSKSGGSAIIWTVEYSVGVAAMDEQHKKLIDILNNFIDSIANRKGKEAIKATLDNLVNYTNIHFGSEEALMKSTGFEHYEEHKEKHRQMLGQIEEFHSRLHSRDLIFRLDLLSFLNDWLTDHILSEDMKYKELFAFKGLS